MSRQLSVSDPLSGKIPTAAARCRRGISAPAKGGTEAAATASSQAPACASENFPKSLLTAFNGTHEQTSHAAGQSDRPYKKRRRADAVGCLRRVHALAARAGGRWEAVLVNLSTTRMRSRPLPPGAPTLVQQAVHDNGRLSGHVDLAIHH